MTPAERDDVQSSLDELNLMLESLTEVNRSAQVLLFTCPEHMAGHRDELRAALMASHDAFFRTLNARDSLRLVLALRAPLNNSTVAQGATAAAGTVPAVAAEGVAAC